MSRNIAQALVKAKVALAQDVNTHWKSAWESFLDDVMSKFPSGAGFDAGPPEVMVNSERMPILIKAEFHPMDDYGHYEEWLKFTVIAKPSWDGIEVAMTKPFPEEHAGLDEFILEEIHDWLISPYDKKLNDFT
tara:strand:- start:60 stop:458 length:399 start_codon:yes stop_codon:yes gene_type:complete